jgi:hypothetical protein
MGSRVSEDVENAGMLMGPEVRRRRTAGTAHVFPNRSRREVRPEQMRLARGGDDLEKLRLRPQWNPRSHLAAKASAAPCWPVRNRQHATMILSVPSSCHA